MKHTLSVLLQNKPGVLSRVTGLFSGRGFNIESLFVAETLDPKVSCLTIITSGYNGMIEQITKQLHKLIDVIKVVDIDEGEFVEREMVEAIINILRPIGIKEIIRTGKIALARGRISQ
jgi:acetolactate synthase-1/3 small subunit